MNFLTPPTDSLYKFMAIAGIVLAALGITLTVSISNDQFRKVEPLAVAAEVERAKVNEIKVEHAANAKSLKVIEDQIKYAIKPNPADMRERLSLLHKEEVLSDENNQVDRNTAEIAAKFDLLKLNQDNIHFEVKALTWLACIGLLLAAAGFGFWYQHIQVHQDRTARLDAEYRDLDVRQHREDLALKQTDLALKKLELEEKQKANQAVLDGTATGEDVKELAASDEALP